MEPEIASLPEQVPAKVPANTVLKELKRVKENSDKVKLDSERNSVSLKLSVMT
jgi:hypothetical protein